MVLMETKRLIIRDYKESDLDEMHRLWSDKVTMYYLDDILTNTINETTKYLEIGMKNADGHYFCICDKATGYYMGSIGYTITDTTPLGKVVHMGYMLLPEHHGRGYMPEAVKKVIEFAFTKDDCIRMTTGCIVTHEKSRRVMEKVGFRKEGEKKKAQYHDGAMKDRLEYALNKDEASVLLKKWSVPNNSTFCNFYNPGTINNVSIIPYEPTYRDDMLFCFLAAKDAIGGEYAPSKCSKPILKDELLDIELNYIARGDVFYLAINKQDRVVGMIGTHTVYLTDLWLKRLFIKPEFKGMGIGSKLLAAVEKYAIEKGITTIHTRFANWYREAAIFYPSKGFVEVDSTDPEDYRRYMIKILTQPATKPE